MKPTDQESYDRCCRLCAEEQEVSFMIFSSETETMLLQNKLNKYLLIEVDEDDKLPKNICVQCCSKLQNVCDFIDNARKAQEILLNRSIMLEQLMCENNYMPRKIQIKCEPESQSDHDSEIEINVDPMMVLQNSESALSPSYDLPVMENVTHLYSVDSEMVTIKVIKSESTKELDHDKKENMLKPFPCYICNKSYCTELALKNHSWVHNDEPTKKYKCATCNAGFDFKCSLITHLKSHRSLEKCQICGRKFRNDKNLEAHMNAHISPARTYTCKVCSRSYSTKSNLKTHSITHSNERPFQCSFCKKSFKRNQDMKFHINQHTGAKPYKCTFCDKTFASSGNCYSHRNRMHPGEKKEVKFKKHIPKALPRKVATKPLAEPTLVHVAGKSYLKFQCQLCDHSFGNRDHFRYHMFQHTGDKPFHCSFCDETFVTRKGLLIHHDKQHACKDRPLALLSKNVLLK